MVQSGAVSLRFQHRDQPPPSEVRAWSIVGAEPVTPQAPKSKILATVGIGLVYRTIFCTCAHCVLSSVSLTQNVDCTCVTVSRLALFLQRRQLEFFAPSLRLVPLEQCHPMPFTLVAFSVFSDCVAKQWN